jgi:hypothetical protein
VRRLYGARGTNFGGCVATDRDVRLAGQGSGLRPGMSVQTRPEFPSALVTFEDGRPMYVDRASGVKRQLNMNWVAGPDYSHQTQSPGGGN